MTLIFRGWRSLTGWWQDAFFQEAPSTPLDIVRIGLGIALLLGYGLASANLFELHGMEGLVTPESARIWSNGRWSWSLLFLLTADWQVAVFQVVFLLACAAFTLGWQTRWAKWIVLVGHLSFVYRNPIAQYGVDSIFASTLFLLCLAPIGDSLSLDARRRPVGDPDRLGTRERRRRAWGFACLRLIQLQVAVMFFFSGVEKVRGDAWWHGYAVWMALTNQEFSNVPIGWLASHFWIVNLLTQGTMFFEVAYPFLIWGRATRPFFLVGAILLHLGMAVMMGLYLFSFVMIVVHLSFVRPEWLAAWTWRRAVVPPLQELEPLRLPTAAPPRPRSEILSTSSRTRS
jgi:HTTM domain